MIRADFLIAGAGVIGVCISRELKRRFPRSKIVVLEKEQAAGQHASGRNSGVLHAVFYYSPDSLKARFTRVGNAVMQKFCDEHHHPLDLGYKSRMRKSALKLHNAGYQLVSVDGKSKYTFAKASA